MSEIPGFPEELRGFSPESEVAFKAHMAAIERAQNADIAAAGPTPERLVAIRTELIRLAHSPQYDAGQIVARADAYLSFILNGTATKGESTSTNDTLLGARQRHNSLVLSILNIMGIVAADSVAMERDDLSDEFERDIENAFVSLGNWKARFWQTQTAEGRSFIREKGHLTIGGGRADTSTVSVAKYFKGNTYVGEVK